MLRFLTSGESHGEALSVILEGIPAGMTLSEDYIAEQMARRQRGYGRGGRMQIEKDFAHILSGVRHGKTLGGPIGMFIENKDWVNWTQQMSVAPVEEPAKVITRIRPGHADLAGTMKYGQDDVRNVLERSSARESAARVAAGAIARKFLEEMGIALHSHSISIGGVWAKPIAPEQIDWEQVEQSQVRVADPAIEAAMIKRIDQAKEAGDTMGGIVEVIATGVPIGLGSFIQWDRKIDARIAFALMSMNAVKAVSIGDGWEGSNLPGSEFQDVIEPVTDPAHPWQRRTNRSGGTEGGMTNGMPVVARFAVKPIATLAKPLPSVDLITGEKVQAHFERSDVCQVPPAGVIGETMVGLVLAEAFLEKFGGDHIEETRRNYLAYQKTVGPRNRARVEESPRKPTAAR
ncbi:MAG: chorismate synthase [Dehalococcoidia bacterium]|nr:chorismate synthase [Dehalococcoidia bacterium]